MGHHEQKNSKQETDQTSNHNESAYQNKKLYSQSQKSGGARQKNLALDVSPILKFVPAPLALLVLQQAPLDSEKIGLRESSLGRFDLFYSVCN